MMFAKYFEYYTIILRGPFFRGHAVDTTLSEAAMACVCVCVCGRWLTDLNNLSITNALAVLSFLLSHVVFFLGVRRKLQSSTCAYQSTLSNQLVTSLPDVFGTFVNA